MLIIVGIDTGISAYMFGVIYGIGLVLFNFLDTGVILLVCKPVFRS